MSCVDFVVWVQIWFFNYYFFRCARIFLSFSHWSHSHDLPNARPNHRKKWQWWPSAWNIQKARTFFFTIYTYFVRNWNCKWKWPWILFRANDAQHAYVMHLFGLKSNATAILRATLSILLLEFLFRFSFPFLVSLSLCGVARTVAHITNEQKKDKNASQCLIISRT